MSKRVDQLVPGDIIVEFDVEEQVMTVPIPDGGPHGRWIFEVKDLATKRRYPHHSQPHFELKVREVGAETYDEELIDNLAREIYQARSKSSREMTDERWADIKARFRGSARVCREEAIRMLDMGEFDD